MDFTFKILECEITTQNLTSLSKRIVIHLVMWSQIAFSYYSLVRALFKWLSKVIRRLRLINLVTGLKIWRQIFNQNQSYVVRVIFTAPWENYGSLLGILIGSSRCSLLLLLRRRRLVQTNSNQEWGKTVYACVLCFQSIFRSCAAWGGYF